MDNRSEKEDRSKQPIRGYEILERIGSGGMGTIYRARQLSMDRIVALKILKKSEHKDPIPLDRLRREALIIARMDHPNIVKGIDMGETDKYYFFAMEYVRGRSIKSLLDLHGAMDELGAASIIREVTQALLYADKQKLTHRDIKPGNILISTDKQTKLTDLGLAKGETDLTITREGTTVGTPQYISPEQAKNPRDVDIRSDIYSLGATFYHMVTGRMPFEGETMAEVLTKVLFSRPAVPEAIRPGVSAGTSRVISRMMAKDPNRRYQSPQELLDDLDVLIEALTEGSRELAQFIGMTWKDSQQRRRFGRAPLYGSVGLVGAAALIILFLIQGGGRDENVPGKGMDAVRGLRKDYASGRLMPAQALGRIAELPADYDERAVNSLRERVLQDSRRMIEDLLQPDSVRFDRAIAKGGFTKASREFERIAQEDASRALGAEPSRLSPELQNYWNERMHEARTSMLNRVGEDRASLIKEARDKLEARSLWIGDQISAGSFLQAWQELESLRKMGGDLVFQAAETLMRRLIARTGLKSVKAETFMEEDLLASFRSEVDEKIKWLEQALKGAIQSAQQTYLKALEAECRSIIAGSDLHSLERGMDNLIGQGVENLRGKAPKIPEGLALSLAGPESLAEVLSPLLAERRSELKADLMIVFRERLFAAIDESMMRCDFDGALRRLEEAAAEPGADGLFIERWRSELKDLGDIEPCALRALDEFKLDTQFNTTGGVSRYEGRVQAVDPVKRRLFIVLRSGQRVALNFAELKVADVLAWCGKIRVLEPWSQGLYAYYRGDLDLAERYIDQAMDFEEAPLYKERIEEQRLKMELKRSTANQEVKLLLEDVESAIEAEDWEKGLALLKEGAIRFRSLPEWTKTRRRRESLRADCNALQAEAERVMRVNELFSVPVVMVDAGRVKVSYTFENREELADFKDRGKNWKMSGDALMCGEGAKDKNQDFFHKVTGVRFGTAFTPEKSMVVTFDYRPPVEGDGPRFMGISFFGACIGIRSFPESGHEGQVNAWTGDLDSYEEYFYIPDFGEERPRKGKVQRFQFQKGELYHMELHWTPGRELLFKVDGKNVYKTGAPKPSREGIEIKTLRTAVIESLTLEGTLKGD